MVDCSICSLFSYGSISGCLYIIVSTGMCAITCVCRKRPIYGMKVWYQLLLRIVNIVMVLGSFFAANLAQCMAI